MIQEIYKQLAVLLKEVGVTGDISFSTPPHPDMGDLAFACFPLAKDWGKAPNVIAEELQSKILNQKLEIVSDVKVFGPYVNFFLDKNEVAQRVLEGISSNDTYGRLDAGNGKHILIEYACPNPMKAFHLGHLKNLITGESIVRLMENAGYDVVRVNYQGDVGMHIAKSLWGLFDWIDEFEAMKSATLKEQVEFLGKAYAHGATAYEESDEKKIAVVAYNKKVYEHDPTIQDVYQTARSWSLEYFDTIYESLGSRFDRLYFESEVFERGRDIVLDGLERGVFFKSDGAILFPGEQYGLHDRVYLNSEGFPTYDAKDLALSELRFKEYPNTDEIIHVVGKEQTEYFKVVFKAIEVLGMSGAHKESHIPGGFLQLKGDQKMSSRRGNIVTGDALLTAVRETIEAVMRDSQIENKEDVCTKVTAAALKYAMLKADITKDVFFDIEESVSTSGNSGPYLLYIVARINSILKKVGDVSELIDWSEIEVLPEEHSLVMRLAEYPLVTTDATVRRDTSVIAKYLFDLAQAFNSFYAVASVAESEGSTQAFRVQLIEQVRDLMTRGLWILGIETVEEM